MSIPPTALAERLEDWQRHGLLSAAQAAAIADHEHLAELARRPTPSASLRDRTTAAEAIGYVGAALVLGAVSLFLGEFWQELRTGGQLALAVLTTVVLAGAAGGARGTASPAVRRLVSVLLAGVVAGAAWTTTIVTAGLLDRSWEDVALASGLVALAAAVPIHLVRRRALGQVTVLVATLVVVTALLDRPPFALEGLWAALPYAGIGALWWSLGEGGYLPPRVVATTSGSVVTLLALQFGSFGGDHRLAALTLGVVVASGLVTWSVVRGGLHHLGVGAVGAFLLVPQLVIDRFGDAIGAPATLLLVGIVLVLLAVGLGRVRREVTDEAAAP